MPAKRNNNSGYPGPRLRPFVTLFKSTELGSVRRTRTSLSFPCVSLLISLSYVSTMNRTALQRNLLKLRVRSLICIVKPGFGWLFGKNDYSSNTLSYLTRFYLETVAEIRVSWFGRANDFSLNYLTMTIVKWNNILFHFASENNFWSSFQFCCNKLHLLLFVILFQWNHSNERSFANNLINYLIV